MYADQCPITPPKKKKKTHLCPVTNSPLDIMVQNKAIVLNQSIKMFWGTKLSQRIHRFFNNGPLRRSYDEVFQIFAYRMRRYRAVTQGYRPFSDSAMPRQHHCSIWNNAANRDEQSSQAAELNGTAPLGEAARLARSMSCNPDIVRVLRPGETLCRVLLCFELSIGKSPLSTRPWRRSALAMLARLFR